jgi:hypothetical protein
MTAAERIGARNTAFVQIGLGIGCLLVGALLLLVMTRPGNGTVGFPISIVTLVLIAVAMFRRGRRGLQRVAEPRIGTYPAIW